VDFNAGVASRAILFRSGISSSLLEMQIQDPFRSKVFRNSVSELDGTVDFHEATANWAHTTMAVGSDANILTGTTIQVQCLSLSGCFARSRANRCSFMKLNIEGAEFGFIRGATESDLCRVDTIVAELHFDLALGESETELINKLAAAGFRSQILPSDSKFRAFLVARR